MKTKERLCKRIILSIFSLLVLCRTAGAQDARKGILSAADAGTCTANSTACSFLTIPSGSGGVTFTITSNASANTIQFEATGDTEPTGSHTWVALNVVPSNGTTAVTSTTSTGTWQANIAGFTQVRLRCSTFVGGTTTTYINLSTASARSNGGGGSVTHTAGNLTAFHIMIGNGAADATVDSACVTNGTGALSGCTSLSAGSGASAAGATATGGFAAVEAASTGWTPTAGQDYMRADSTLHTFVCSLNGVAEAACASSALSGLTAAAASNTIANGNNPQTWNWAQTSNTQSGITFGETSAATGGTLTSGLANQAEVAISTASGSTATPLKVVQGSVTGATAFPALQIATTWNNAGLTGEGLLLNVTNTASGNNSVTADFQVGNARRLALGTLGTLLFGGTAAITSVPLLGAPGNAGAWKYCIYNTAFCTGHTGYTQYNLIAEGNANGWLSASTAAAADNSTSTVPDTAAGASLGAAGGLSLKENACGTSFANDSGRTILCPDSTAHEFMGYVNGATSAGMMMRAQPGAIHQTAQTAAITTATLCASAAGACNTAGNYTVEWAFTETGTACATPTTGGVTFLLTWTDQNGTAHSAISLPMDDSASLVATSGTFTFRTSLAAAWASGNFNISSNGSIIQYATGYTACGVGTGTYQLDAWVTRKR